MREVCGSNLGPVKLDKVLPSARHHCDIFFKMKRVARAQRHGDGPYKLVTRFGVMQRVKWKIWFWYKYYKCYTLARSQFYFQCRPNVKADLFFCVYLENLAEYLQNFCSYKIYCNDYYWSVTKLRLPRQRLKKSDQSCKVQARTREVIWSQNQAGKKTNLRPKMSSVIGTTHVRVACFSVFTRPFSN